MMMESTLLYRFWNNWLSRSGNANMAIKRGILPCVKSILLFLSAIGGYRLLQYSSIYYIVKNKARKTALQENAFRHGDKYIFVL